MPERALTFASPVIYSVDSLWPRSGPFCVCRKIQHTPEAVERFLDSTLDSVDSAEELAVGMAQRAGMDEDDLMKIGMAMRESMVNAVVHGNRYNANKKVRFAVASDAERFTVRIADEGEGFDFEFDARSAGAGEPDAHIGPRDFSDPVVHGRFPDAASGIRRDRSNFGKNLVSK